MNAHGGLAKALSLYYGGNLPPLMATKRRWDPLDCFQHAQSIPLT